MKNSFPDWTLCNWGHVCCPLWIKQYVIAVRYNELQKLISVHHSFSLFTIVIGNQLSIYGAIWIKNSMSVRPKLLPTSCDRPRRHYPCIDRPISQPVMNVVSTGILCDRHCSAHCTIKWLWHAILLLHFIERLCWIIYGEIITSKKTLYWLAKCGGTRKRNHLSGPSGRGGWLKSIERFLPRSLHCHASTWHICFKHSSVNYAINHMIYYTSAGAQPHTPIRSAINLIVVKFRGRLINTHTV